MASIAALRQQIANVIAAAVPALTVYPTYVENPTPPCALVETAPGVVEAFATFDGSMDFQMRVVLLLSAASVGDSQIALDGLVDSSAAGSVLAAISANGRMNGTCQYCIPTRVGSAPAGGALHGYQLVEWAGLQYLGTNIVLDVAI